MERILERHSPFRIRLTVLQKNKSRGREVDPTTADAPMRDRIIGPRHGSRRKIRPWSRLRWFRPRSIRRWRCRRPDRSIRARTGRFQASRRLGRSSIRRRYPANPKKSRRSRRSLPGRRRWSRSRRRRNCLPSRRRSFHRKRNRRAIAACLEVDPRNSEDSWWFPLPLDRFRGRGWYLRAKNPLRCFLPPSRLRTFVRMPAFHPTSPALR